MVRRDRVRGHRRNDVERHTGGQTRTTRDCPQRREEMKTSELSGAALDWAVKKAIKKDGGYFLPSKDYKNISHSTDWAHGGPIIEREVISIGKHTWDDEGVISWGASKSGLYQGAPFSVGPTPLIAAMRCYVASKLGNEVEIPEELK